MTLPNHWTSPDYCQSPFLSAQFLRLYPPPPDPLSRQSASMRTSSLYIWFERDGDRFWLQRWRRVFRGIVHDVPPSLRRATLTGDVIALGVDANWRADIGPFVLHATRLRRRSAAEKNTRTGHNHSPITAKVNPRDSQNKSYFAGC